MARSASLDSYWLPTYGWWPPSDEYALSAFLVPYHAAVDERARFSFTLRGYDGSDQPLWEHDIGEVGFGDQRVVTLEDVGIAAAPEPHGGVLEIHSVRLDQPPPKGTGWIGMLLDVRGRAGGGYLIPTVPIRGAAKVLVQDDTQVVPGVVVTADTDTELLILNPIGERTEVELTLAAPDGVSTDGAAVVVEPWSAWSGSLRSAVPRARKLLEPSNGIGSLVLTSGHRMLPFFGFRRDGHAIVSLDHAAPIFGEVKVKRRVAPPGG
ncbi:MAG: hypothetical protein H0T43_04110 [Solirubrobacterales bacterium]|nr:hypothetical protein [Solirubrobacterales bacterium]